MAPRFTNFYHTVVLTASSSRQLRLSLADFRTCAEADYAGLLEESGTVLMESGTLPPDQSAIVGALANGAFIAVRELATRLGDDCCEGLYHQGRTKHFSIVPLSPVTTLITVFGNQTKLGIVRSAIARHGPALRDLLEDSTLAASYANAQDGDLMLSPLPHGAFHEALPEAPPMPQPESKSPLSFFVFNEASTPPSPLPAPAAGFAMEDAFLAHAVRFSPFIPLPPLQPSESNGVSE